MSDNEGLFRELVRVRSIVDSKQLSCVEINRLAYSINTFVFLQNGGVEVWSIISAKMRGAANPHNTMSRYIVWTSLPRGRTCPADSDLRTFEEGNQRYINADHAC
jgi:hypothetical protein